MAQVISILGNVEGEASPVRGGVPNQQASGADFGAQIGQALQGFGQNLGNLAMTVAQEQAQRQAFTEEASFIDFQSAQQGAFTEAARGASGSNALGFTATRMKDLDAAWAEWTKANPTANPERREAEFRAFRAKMGQQALTTELETTDKFYATQIGDKLDLFSKGILQSPADAETYIQQGEAFIDASGLPDGVKQQLKTGWRESAAAAKANALLQSDPAALQGALTGQSSAQAFLQRLYPSESGGRFDAQNDVEGAGGKGHFGRVQFSRARLEEAKAAGAIPANMTPEEFLNSPSAQQAAELWHIGDIDKHIEAKGYLQRGYSLDGLRAVAHLGGKPGLDKFVATGGQYNPADANGTKLSDYYQRFSTGAADPVLANLSYADTLRFADQASNAVASIERDTALAAKAEYDSKLNSLLNGLNDGTMGVGAIEAARAEGWLTDFNDIKKAQGILTTANEKQASLTAGVAALNDQDTIWNPFDKDQKKQMDAVAAATPDPVTTGYNIWSRTGILPEPSVAALRNGLISTDPTKVLGAARIAGNMIAANPNAFAGVGDGRPALEEAGIEFNRQVNQLGRTPEEAAQALATLNDPTVKATAPKREDVTAFEQTLRKDGVTADILDTFDPGVFSSEPEGGLTAAQQAVMDGDYIAFATENFRIYGDEGRAREYAAAQMKKLYGVSNGRVTKYPPEKIYPPIGETGHQYIYDQAVTDIKAATGRDVLPENVYLVPQLKGATAEAWRQGKLPPYQLTYVYEDPETGQMLFDTAPGKMFMADPKAPAAAASADRQQQFEAANTEERTAAMREEEERYRMQQEMMAKGLWNPAPEDIIPRPSWLGED
jgi:hypothetical protein